MPKQPNAQRVMACIARNPEWNDVRIANSLALSIHYVRAVMRGENPADTTALPDQPRSAGVVSLSSIREKLDTRAAILREVATMPTDQLIEEREMRQRVCGHDANRFRRTVENNADFFKAYRIKLRLDEGEARWWWARAETVAEALRLRDL